LRELNKRTMLTYENSGSTLNNCLMPNVGNKSSRRT